MNAGNAPPVAVKELAQMIHSDLPVGAGIDLDHAREVSAPRCTVSNPAMVAVAGFVPWRSAE